MIKKLFSFVCCLLPFGAGAVTTIDGTVTSYPSGLSATSSNSIEVTGGSGISLGAAGLSVYDSLLVGTNYSSDTGIFYIDSGISDYTIASAGDISIASVLQVLGASSLTLNPTDGATIDISAASVNNQGTLIVGSGSVIPGTFTATGNIANAGTLAVSAGVI